MSGSPVIASYAHRLRRRGSLLALAAVAACGDGTGPGGRDALRLVGELAKWQSERPSSYRYDFHRSCFCLASVTAPVRLSVTGAAVTEVVSLATAPSWPYAVSLDPQYYPTVEQLFEVIAEAIRADVYRLEVDYDEALGYPRRIVIDRDVNTVDDELTLTAGSLEPTSWPLDARAGGDAP